MPVIINAISLKNANSQKINALFAICVTIICPFDFECIIYCNYEQKKMNNNRFKKIKCAAIRIERKFHRNFKLIVYLCEIEKKIYIQFLIIVKSQRLPKYSIFGGQKQNIRSLTFRLNLCNQNF